MIETNAGNKLLLNCEKQQLRPTDKRVLTARKEGGTQDDPQVLEEQCNWIDLNLMKKKKNTT